MEKVQKINRVFQNNLSGYIDRNVERCKQILDNKVTAILGYGPQGRGQGLNMRDQGFNVILGLRLGRIMAQFGDAGFAGILSLAILVMWYDKK